MSYTKSTFSFHRFVLSILCCLLWLSGTSSSVFAQDIREDDTVISLLTVYPRDKAVYTVFGHTAMRVRSESKGLDLVYNYGYFDSSKPNFIYHFVKGETDYVLGADEFEHFLYGYALHNSHIEEQVLELSADEKTAIIHFLEQNSLPENREYRYDYFFDNCTTRPRDIIESYTKGKVVYPQQLSTTSLRELVSGCTSPYPWLQFGINLIFGSGADSTVHIRTEMFLPVKLMNALDKAHVVSDSVTYPIVKNKVIILQEQKLSSTEETKKQDTAPTPTFVFTLLLILTLSASVIGYQKKRLLRGIDVGLFAAAGIAGIIVCFLCFISTHPCTSNNYNILWLHPLHLVAAVCFLIKSCKRYNNWYHLINFAVLSVFLLSWKFIPQEIPGAGILIASSLWIRSGYNILFAGKWIKKKK